MKTYTGGCSCGAVRYEADIEKLDEAMECNCSNCGKKGFLLKFLPASLFHVTKGEDTMSEYRFNKKVIAHRFCKVCGTQTHGSAPGPDGVEMVALNIRTLDEGVPEDIKVNKVDGRSF